MKPFFRRILVGPTLTALAVATTASGPAFAEDPARRINVLSFEPAPGAGSGVVLDEAIVLDDMHLRFGLVFGAAGDVFVASGSNRPAYNVVESVFGADLTFAFGVFDWLEVGALFPTVFDMRGDAGVGALAPLAAATVGDLRIVPKVRVFGEGDGFHLALVPAFTLPTGTDDRNSGEKGATFEPEVALTWRFAPGTTVSMNLGWRARPAVAFGRLLVDDEFTFAAGATWRITEGFGVAAEIFGAVGLSENRDDPTRGIDVAEVPVEALGALSWTFDNGIAVMAGAGGGLTQGWAAPAWRAFIGVSGTIDIGTPPDADGDGVLDEDDRCPNDPEDKDGFQDDDGCPDLDNDGDGILDAFDRCPNEAEDKDGFEDDDGCPDLDNDGDGVPDTTDRCPNEAEDKDGFEDDDGCPDLDNDGDGIPDTADRCPNEPETRNGFEDDDGCPDTTDVVVTGTKIEFTETILFEPNRAVIMAGSQALLERIAAVIKANPQLTKIRIEGHTDVLGKAADNAWLSAKRAEAVMGALVAAGIDGGRLVSEGVGAARPLCTKMTDKCHAQNRRTELVILEVGGAPIAF